MQIKHTPHTHTPHTHRPTPPTNYKQTNNIIYKQKQKKRKENKQQIMKKLDQLTFFLTFEWEIYSSLALCDYYSSQGHTVHGQYTASL